MKTFQPAVKWSGSKRHLAEEIIRRFPSKIDTYYEPFCGGASVLRRLIDTNAIEVNRYVCSDLNDGLIGLWNEIKDNPDHLLEYYEDLWNELNGDDDLERKKRYFESSPDRLKVPLLPREVVIPIEFIPEVFVIL